MTQIAIYAEVMCLHCVRSYILVDLSSTSISQELQVYKISKDGYDPSAHISHVWDIIIPGGI